MPQPFKLLLKNETRLSGEVRKAGMTLARGDTKDGLTVADLRKVLLRGQLEIVTPDEMSQPKTVQVAGEISVETPQDAPDAGKGKSSRKDSKA